MDYYDLGSYTRKVTTAVPEAQLWFDRGLNWLFGFNHAEAIACFRKALERDSACAMAYWGISYAAGPNYNLPWHLYDPAGKAAALTAAYDAMQGALALAGGAFLKAGSKMHTARMAMEGLSAARSKYKQ